MPDYIYVIEDYFSNSVERLSRRACANKFKENLSMILVDLPDIDSITIMDDEFKDQIKYTIRKERMNV